MDYKDYEAPSYLMQLYSFIFFSESMKYSIPEQVEQKYLPPDQQQALSEHERYFQVGTYFLDW